MSRHSSNTDKPLEAVDVLSREREPFFDWDGQVKCQKRESRKALSGYSRTLPTRCVPPKTQRILEDQQYRMQRRMEEMREQEAARQRKVCLPNPKRAPEPNA